MFMMILRASSLSDQLVGYGVMLISIAALIALVAALLCRNCNGNERQDVRQRQVVRPVYHNGYRYDYDCPEQQYYQQPPNIYASVYPPQGGQTQQAQPVQPTQTRQPEQHVHHYYGANILPPGWNGQLPGSGAPPQERPSRNRDNRRPAPPVRNVAPPPDEGEGDDDGQDNGDNQAPPAGGPIRMRRNRR